MHNSRMHLVLSAGGSGVAVIGCQKFRTSLQWLHRTQVKEDCPTLVADEPSLAMCGCPDDLFCHAAGFAGAD